MAKPLQVALYSKTPSSAASLKNGHALNKVREDPRTQIFVKARTSDRKFSLKRKYMCTCGKLEKDPGTQIFVQGRTPNGKFSSKGKRPHVTCRTAQAEESGSSSSRHDPRLKPPGSGLHLTAKPQALGSCAISCLDARKGEEHHFIIYS